VNQKWINHAVDTTLEWKVVVKCSIIVINGFSGGNNMINKAFSNIDFYKKAVDGTWLRHQTISQNIANVNTPEYKRKVVSFEDQLKDAIGRNKVALKRTNEKHIAKGSSQFSPKVLEDKSTSYRIDGNNVNIDTESAELAKNDIMYNAMINQIVNEFDKIKNVITEGSK